MMGDPYRTQDVPEDFEARLTALEDDHREVKHAAKKYEHAQEVSVWAVRWAKFGLYLLAWCVTLTTAAVILGMFHCNQRETRIERAVDECDCDYMQHVYEREYLRERAEAN